VDCAFSPRVVGRLRPDFHCLEAMLKSPQFAGKQGEELVMAVYNHMTSQVDGTYHFWPSAENEGQPRLRRSCTDPIKILNAYGWAICGQMSHMLQAIWIAAGLKARLYGLPGHALCEVFYDGRWHHVDVDMWSWFRTPQGHLASAYELACNARALIVENQNKGQSLQPAGPKPGGLRRHVLQGREGRRRHRIRSAGLVRAVAHDGLPSAAG
jgi:hypothetical protein